MRASTSKTPLCNADGQEIERKPAATDLQS